MVSDTLKVSLTIYYIHLQIRNPQHNQKNMTQLLTQLKKVFSKKLPSLLIIALLLFLGSAVTSCNRGTGCKMNESNVKNNRKGELSSKRGKTNLFPKKLRKGKK